MQEEYRPWFGRALTVVVTLIAAIVTLIVTIDGGWVDGLQIAPWLALFAVTCWAAFWQPRVVVSDAGVRVVNVTRTIDVPWPALQHIETRFALTLVTAYGKFTAWAAPAPSARTAVQSVVDRPMAGRPDGRALTYADVQRLGDMPDTPSGDAATMVRRRWAQLVESGHLDDPQLEFSRPPVTWHLRTLALVVALIGAGVAGFALG